MLINTRTKEEKSVSAAILKGLGDEGGLFVFANLPQLDIASLCKDNLSYKELSLHILKLLITEFSEEELKRAIDEAYDNCFDVKENVSFKTISDVTFLELYHGPTLAFKDMALRLMPRLFVLAKEKNNKDDKTIILTATSGDTGGASLSGFKGLKDISLVVFYPNGGVSAIQEKQMLSFRSDNTKVIALEGNFDDAQGFVKEMFLKYPNLSSSNSINIGRLIPQIIYYVYSYIYLVRNDIIKINEKINVCVPTGNFGNILASYIAYKMGLPICDFVCASNKNDVLSDFFKNGIYNKKREFYRTISPSMDILISSNLERLLFMKFGRDRVNELYQDLHEKQEFRLTKEELKMLSEFKGYSANEDETKRAINECFKKYYYLIDPHTAVAYDCYLKYKKDNYNNYHTLLVSTASPFKFADAMCEALDIDKGNDSVISLSKYSKNQVPNEILKYKDVNDKIVWKREEKDKKFKELLLELGYKYE